MAVWYWGSTPNCCRWRLGDDRGRQAEPPRRHRMDGCARLAPWLTVDADLAYACEIHRRRPGRHAHPRALYRVISGCHDQAAQPLFGAARASLVPSPDRRRQRHIKEHDGLEWEIGYGCQEGSPGARGVQHLEPRFRHRLLYVSRLPGEPLGRRGRPRTGAPRSRAGIQISF